MSAEVTRPRSARQAFGVACGAAAAAAGLLALAGWAFDVAALKTVLPGLPTMKVNTALAFVLAGASLAVAPRGVGALGAGCAAAVALLAAATLAQHAGGLDLGIDQLLARDDRDGVSPGRMAPATAFMLLALGAALTALHTGRALVPAQALAGLAGLLSALACLGYLYGAEELYSHGPFSTIAVHTAGAALALALGVLALLPAAGLTRLVSDDGVGGLMVRRVLPAAVLIPVLMGWLRLAGQRAGWYDMEFGLALYAVVNVVAFSGLVLATATQVQAFDARRRRAEERYELAVRGSNDGIWDWDIRTNENFFSDRCLQMWGYAPGEVVPSFRTWHDRLHPDDRDGVLSALKRHLAEHAPYDVEYRARTEGGQWRWYRSRGQAVWDADGRPLRMAGSMTDVTDRKAIEEELRELNATLERRVAERTEALRESEQRFRSAFNYAPIGMALVAPDGKWIQVNRALCDLI
ncbi:MAG: PAS domain-containing protein, partial [Gemmataceae bacterium]